MIPFILLGFAFLAGIVTILSPCILPILPIVLSGTVGTGKKKPLGIIVGFIGSFTFFTLFLTKIVQLTGIPSDTLRIIAAAILFFFGVSLLVPAFEVLVEKLFTKLSSLSPKANANTGFFGGILIGLTIGIIWAPCVGPIMASVIALAATSTVTTTTFLITFFYALGSGIPMFFIMIGGRSLLQKVPTLLTNTTKIQKIFGVVMMLVACMIFFNLDRDFEGFIATTKYGLDLTNIENNSFVKNQLHASEDTSGLFNENTLAPEFTGIDKWLDSPHGALTLKSLRGKVILVDFWTYTCINCIRTLPFVTSWYDKYKDQGFIVIGVHTPEFAFEKKTENVANAIKQYAIHYPVAQDNEYATWNAYNNQYWPAEYLIDADGNIRHTHFGEGEYDQTEMAIQALLKEAGHKTDNTVLQMPDQTPTGQLTPETYVGLKRMDRFASLESPNGGMQPFTLPKEIPQDSFGFLGTWNIQDDYAQATKGSAIVFNFYADKVYLVIGPKSAKDSIKVLLDGKPITDGFAGTDVKSGLVTLNTQRLYNLVDLHGEKGTHTLRLEFQSDGDQLFAFTFG